jgi:hypothetical protein
MHANQLRNTDLSIKTERISTRTLHSCLLEGCGSSAQWTAGCAAGTSWRAAAGAWRGGRGVRPLVLSSTRAARLLEGQPPGRGGGQQPA